jgi:hypothetical protein
MTPTPATMTFLVAIGERWGTAWARTLAREIAAGTFTHLDGAACMEASRAPEYEQGALL